MVIHHLNKVIATPFTCIKVRTMLFVFFHALCAKWKVWKSKKGPIMHGRTSFSLLVKTLLFSGLHMPYFQQLKAITGRLTIGDMKWAGTIF